MSKVIKLFDNEDFARHILRMFQRCWQDQYEHTGAMVMQSMQTLLEVLKHINKAFLAKKEHEGTCGSAKGGGSSKKKIVTSRSTSQRSAALMQSYAFYASSMGMPT